MMHAPPPQQLLTAYQQIKGEVEASRETAVAAVEKEHKAAQIVASLTAVSPLPFIVLCVSVCPCV